MKGMKAFRALTLCVNAIFFTLMLFFDLMAVTGVRTLSQHHAPLDELMTILMLIAFLTVNAVSLYIDYVLERKA